MGETFYTVLGVEADAEVESIRSAYRDLVKEHHPDISDDPDAPERFKRLTTAKKVLVDDGERARYDRLGHDAYVRQHVDSSVWSVGTPGRDRTSTTETQRAGGRRTAGTRDRRDRRSPGGTDQRTRQRTQTSGPTPGHREPTGGTARRRRHHTAAGTSGGQSWQQASAVYQRADTDVDPGSSVLRSVFDGARAVGPWLIVHFVLILSALATGWFTFTQASNSATMSLPAVIVSILMVGAVIFLSIIHAVSQIYS